MSLPVCYGYIVSEKISKELELFHTNIVQSSHLLDLRRAKKVLERGLEKQRMVEDFCNSLIYHAQTEAAPKKSIDNDIKVLKNSLNHSLKQISRVSKALNEKNGTFSSKTKKKPCKKKKVRMLFCPLIK